MLIICRPVTIVTVCNSLWVLVALAWRSPKTIQNNSW